MPRRTAEGVPAVNLDEVLEDWSQLRTVVMLAVGRVSGWTVEELAEKMNVSSRVCYTDLDRYRTVIKEIERIAVGLVKVNRREVKKIARGEVRTELEGLLGDSVAAIQDAIQNGDLELATKNAQFIVKMFESPAAIKFEGTVNHAHLHVMSPEMIAAFEATALRDSALIARANRLVAPQALDSAPQRPSEAVIDA